MSEIQGLDWNHYPEFTEGESTVYRIAWKYKDNKTSGHGDYIFRAAEDAQPIVDRANRRYPEIEHWVEEEWPDVIGDESQAIQTEDYKR
jgi:hypothetical protein